VKRLRRRVRHRAASDWARGRSPSQGEEGLQGCAEASQQIMLDKTWLPVWHRHDERKVMARDAAHAMEPDRILGIRRYIFEQCRRDGYCARDWSLRIFFNGRFEGGDAIQTNRG